jgi:hypothetical protein
MMTIRDAACPSECIRDVVGGAGLGMMVSALVPPQEYRARDV